MAHKIFYVTRTEDEEQGRAGPASLLRADDPQLMKTYDTKADIIADDENIEENEIVGSEENDFTDITITNTVEDENMNPVTSNAVYNKTKDMLEYPPAPTTFTVVAGSLSSGKVSGSITYTVEERGWYLMGYNNYSAGNSHGGSITINGVLLSFVSSYVAASGVGDSICLPLNAGDVVTISSTYGTHDQYDGSRRYIVRLG